MQADYNCSNCRFQFLYAKFLCPKTYLCMYFNRSVSNPMDKGACNFVNSEIQTWPCTKVTL